MALAAAVLEVRPAGSGADDTNGGGFTVAGTGTDWSLFDAPQYSVTDGVTAGTTTITSATAAFGTDVVDNLIYVQGGTGAVAANRYRIISRTNATTIVVDRSTGLTAGTGVTLKIGGALATPGAACFAALVSMSYAWVKAVTYNMITATPGPGGPVVFPAGIIMIMEGYETTRGDRTGVRPILSWGAVAAPGAQAFLFTTGSTSASTAIRNMTADGNNVLLVSGFAEPNNGGLVSECVAQNCSGASQVGFSSASGLRGNTSNLAIACTIGFGTGSWRNCVADTCTDGFSGAFSVVNCIALDCTDDGFDLVGNGFYCAGCTADGCGGDGFVAGTRSLIQDCVATNNSGGYGYNTTSTTILIDCASYNNTSGRTNVAPHADLNPITLTADPYVSQAGEDLRPNTTAGGGADIRVAGIGIPNQTNNADVGAVQHSDPAAAGGMLRHPGMQGGLNA